MNKKRVKNFSWWILGVLLVIVLFVIIFISLKTGVFDRDGIDDLDLEYWNYNSDGIIEGAEEFSVNGSRDTCWLMIHGYGATPMEFRNLSYVINKEFGDYIYVPRLEGHGGVPSRLLNLNLSYWYEQIETDFDNLSSECNSVNLLGFSFGGALALKLAEEKEANRVFVIAGFLGPSYRPQWIISLEWVLKKFSDIIIYVEKNKIAQINDPEGLEDYVSYLNFALQPVKNSFVFLEELRKNAGKITEPIIFFHSTSDKTASYYLMRDFFEGISSKDSSFFVFKDSNHVVHYDYDREAVFSGIVNFERERR
jgi:carboxylesterase